MNPLPLLSAAAALAPFFPAIVRLIKGEGGSKMAQDILTVAKTVTGKESLEHITRALSKDQDALLAFQTHLKQMQFAQDKNLVDDRCDARKRDRAFIAARTQNIRADIMVVCAASGLVLCLLSLALYRGTLPGEAVGIISTIAGIFGSCLKDAYAFEFGSSRGSKEKDMQVKNILNHF